MEISYERGANYSFLVIGTEEKIADNYKVNMLINNKIAGLLKTGIRSFNNTQEIYYDISSKSSMEKLYGRSKMTEEEIREFIFGLSRAVESVKEYLLDINCICLRLDMIFINPRNKMPEFCYYPANQSEFFSGLRHLLQSMLALVDHERREAVIVAYGLQQIIVNENYTVEELLDFVMTESRIEESSENGEEQSLKPEDEIKTEEDKYGYDDTGNDLYHGLSNFDRKEEKNKKEKHRGGEKTKKPKTLSAKISRFLKNGFLKGEELTTLEELEKND